MVAETTKQRFLANQISKPSTQARSPTAVSYVSERRDSLATCPRDATICIFLYLATCLRDARVCTLSCNVSSRRENLHLSLTYLPTCPRDARVCNVSERRERLHPFLHLFPYLSSSSSPCLSKRA